MKLTKDNLSKAIINADISGVEVMYNWDQPSDLTCCGAQTDYDWVLGAHSMLFNNSKDGNDHFFEGTVAKLLTSALPGISVGSTNNALSTNSSSSWDADGYGTFAGTDLIRISKEIAFEDWSVIINFEEDGSPTDPSERRILLSSTGSNATDGFNLGINGAKNLFYEFYDTNGILRVYTILKTLEERSIVAVCKSNSLKNISIYVFNSIDSTSKKLSVITEDAQLGTKWCLGGISPIPTAGDFNQMFEGKVYEFLLFSSYLSEEQITEMSESFLADAIINEGYQTVTETYYPTTGHTEQQVQIGTEITGYTDQSTTIQDESGATITMYEQVPVTSPIYQTQVSYTQDTNASTRDVEQLIPASKTYDHPYIKNYAPTCILLEDAESSAPYEIYLSNKYTKYITKKGLFVAGSGHFTLEEDYDSQKLVVIYVNGLLAEEDVDYTRNGININKYTGEYTQDDVFVYDVIDGGTQSFQAFSGGVQGDLFNGDVGSDLYLDGLKLILNQDYQDSGGDLLLNQTVGAGRLAIITRHDDISIKIDGTIDVFDNLLQSIVSEMLWVNGLRKLKGVEYYLNNPRDLANSNLIVPEKTTVIYENNGSYFNI